MSDIELVRVSCLPVGTKADYKGEVEYQRKSKKDPAFKDVVNREVSKLRQGKGASSEPSTSERPKGFRELHLSFIEANGRKQLTIVDLVEGNEECAKGAAIQMDEKYNIDARTREINSELAELRSISQDKHGWKLMGGWGAIMSTVPITFSALQFAGALSKPSDPPTQRYVIGAGVGTIGLVLLTPLAISLINGSWGGNESDRIDALKKELNQYDQGSIAPTSVSVAPTLGGVQAAATWRF